MAVTSRLRPDLLGSCGGPAMPTRAEDYEVLHTIGTGSYGRCQKIRRKSDGKVSVGPFPAPAPAKLSTACGERLPPRKREAWDCGSSRLGARKGQPSPPDGMGVCFLFPLLFHFLLFFSCFDFLRAFQW